MTYFHMRMHTIIGAKSFHCPVRDGKEWGQLAMVVRHNWYQKTEDGGLKTGGGVAVRLLFSVIGIPSSVI